MSSILSNETTGLCTYSIGVNPLGDSSPAKTLTVHAYKGAQAWNSVLTCLPEACQLTKKIAYTLSKKVNQSANTLFQEIDFCYIGSVPPHKNDGYRFISKSDGYYLSMIACSKDECGIQAQFGDEVLQLENCLQVAEHDRIIKVVIAIFQIVIGLGLLSASAHVYNNWKKKQIQQKEQDLNAQASPLERQIDQEFGPNEPELTAYVPLVGYEGEND